MSQDRVNLIMIRGLVASMAPADQDRVKAAAEQLRALINQHGDAGVIALSLVAAERFVEA